ncbi:LOW QUALITY PROTEIN: hypothetical protein TorRG33x02_256880 [Trema orientale]|uniref:Transmembrane protein n=1 Tax=Trema orientale TaxID=63057 RepID=A0A2P5DAL8_TREOI|nr:LOW QUALITY PROTEIN: hypothetical protein TorRG33x02_256880 [Trema orientale]
MGHGLGPGGSRRESDDDPLLRSLLRRPYTPIAKAMERRIMERDGMVWYGVLCIVLPFFGLCFSKDFLDLFGALYIHIDVLIGSRKITKPKKKKKENRKKKKV